MRALVISSALSSALVLCCACGTEADVDAQTFANSDGALDATAILRFVNSAAASEEVLDVDAALDARAARSIMLHVWGDDQRFGTSDDDLCETLAELDSLSYVGDSTLRALDAYVRTLSPSTPAPAGPSVVVEGVTFTSTEAASALVHCNERSEQQLDEDVGLDARAAAAIVDGRPHASLDTIAAASYVGAGALEKIRAYAQLHPVGTTPTPGTSPTAPRILLLTAAVHTDVDPEWEETLDGVLTTWSTEGATSCDLAVTSLDGALLEHHAGVGTSGERFDAGWTVTNTSTPHVAVVLTCRNSSNVTVVETARTSNALPTPGEIGCDATGGSYDGVAFTQAQECAAARFMNLARWSQMGLASDAARRIAYDGSSSGTLGQRLSTWTNVASFSSLGGVGRTAVQSIKDASAAWVDDGAGRFDTVALTWQNRAALVAAQAPISLDRVFVTRKTVDFEWPTSQRACIEIRDFEGAPNFLEACLFFINADSAPGCTDHHINDCLDGVVGDFAKIRGKVRAGSNGRISITMHSDGPMEPRAALD
jgi:hypothetical protein